MGPDHDRPTNRPSTILLRLVTIHRRFASIVSVWYRRIARTTTVRTMSRIKKKQDGFQEIKKTLEPMTGSMSRI